MNSRNSIENDISSTRNDKSILRIVKVALRVVKVALGFKMDKYFGTKFWSKNTLLFPNGGGIIITTKNSCASL